MKKFFSLKKIFFSLMEFLKSSLKLLISFIPREGFSPFFDLLIEAYLRGRNKTPIKRYARIEYSSPMDVGYEYKLLVYCLIQRYGHVVEEGIIVRWATLHVEAEAAEPFILVRPLSSYFSIKPSTRKINLFNANDDVQAEFQIAPLRTIPESSERCEIQIEFEYQNKIIRKRIIEVEIQDPFVLGRIKIPHYYWKRFLVLGGVLGMFDTIAGFYERFFPNDSPILIALIAGNSLILAFLILFAIVLWRKANRRILVPL